MSYRAPVSDIGFTLKHVSGFGTALEQGLYGDLSEDDVAAVLEHCRGQLADFKIPQYVTVVEEELPRNAGGKLLKGKLRQQVHWGEPLR